MNPSTHEDPLFAHLAERLDEPFEQERELIEAALGDGRRIRRRRHLAAGSALLAMTLAGVTAGAALLRPADTVEVAGTPSPQATVPATRTPAPNRPSAAASVEYEQLGIPATRGELAIIRRHLAGFELTWTDDAMIDAVSLQARDARGTSWAAAGMGHQNWHSLASAGACTPQTHCVETRLGTSRVLTTTDAEKPGHGQWTFLVRQDGYTTWFAQQGALDNKVTRPGRMLTDKQVVALLSDPAWEREFAVVPTSSRPLPPSPSPHQGFATPTSTQR